MGFNFARSQKKAHNFIARWGGKGLLVRNGVARSATMARLDYTPRERAMFLDGAERFLVSSLDQPVGPEYELDVIQFRGREYRIAMPPTGPKPFDIQIFWDCSVLFSKPTT